jgi:transposase InsO family protein
MPWKVQELMSSRQEFVSLAMQSGAKVSQLCRRFGISRKTGNKWLRRFREQGGLGLSDRSRRPRSSPAKTTVDLEKRVLEVRRSHSAWGGRKIRAYLCQRGVTEVPAASTITAILQRHGLIEPAESVKHRALQRFERDLPNDLWQMDFKGWFTVASGVKCHPLTVLDDHSRYAVGLQACSDERGQTVQRELTKMFRTYGIPRQMLMDNGSPWGCDLEFADTWLTVWLMRLGIGVSHGRPYHPQTQGKEERFHRTLKAEVLRGRCYKSLPEVSQRFVDWREEYNRERPHEALGMAAPASRYRVSDREFPERLPAIEYGPGDEVRKVQDSGELHYCGVVYRLSSAYHGEPVALRANVTEESRREVWYCQQMLGHLNLREGRFERRTYRREG